MTGSSRVLPDPERDPGAQPERTRLAWRRTTLTFLVSVGLALRTVAVEGGAVVTVVAVATGALAWLGFLAVAHLRISGMGAARPGRMSPVLVMAAALCTLAMTVVGGVLIL